MEEYFGDHLILDAINCNVDLWDLTFISDYLLEMCNLAKMTPIAPPYSFKYQGIDPMDVGTSGCLLLAESHLTCHTFPLRDSFVTLDLYTCRKLDNLEDLVNFFKDKFKTDEVEIQVLKRGRNFIRKDNKYWEKM